ncbi:PsiF family protein [Methylibium sp.]|uniref:PsiF family protein n=1 Tax=Methylibium sp. TaxID=2067992 RepID=UPI003D0B1115
MKHLLTAAALCAAVLTAPVLAADGAASAPGKPTAQQSKMGTCNKDAADKKGDERKAFMKECLSAKKSTQQDKMKTCNKDASGKKGDERKAFMKECLSGK